MMNDLGVLVKSTWCKFNMPFDLTPHDFFFPKPPFQYQYMPDLLRLPSGASMLNGHGLAKDKNGNIYFTFQATSVDDRTRVLVRFNSDGTGGVLLGDDNRLAVGVPHGLRIRTESDGQQYLYHSNNDAIVHKTFLNGSLIWSVNEVGGGEEGEWGWDEKRQIEI